MSKPQIVSVYRSKKDEGMYLIVPKQVGLKNVPQPLLDKFGPAKESMAFLLTPEKPLARFEATQVLESISERGYFLQLPPPRDDEMAEIAIKNAKLPR